MGYQTAAVAPDTDSGISEAVGNDFVISAYIDLTFFKCCSLVRSLRPLSKAFSIFSSFLGSLQSTILSSICLQRLDRAYSVMQLWWFMSFLIQMYFEALSQDPNF